MEKARIWDAIVVGGGIAGLSAAIYLGRARRHVLVIDSGKSMARWEPRVQNYLGYPQGVSGPELLRRGRKQARLFRSHFTQDEVVKASRQNNYFRIVGRKKIHHARFVLLATGIFHIPSDINGVEDCLGHSMFFCKDCDGLRVRGNGLPSMGQTTKRWNTPLECSSTIRAWPSSPMAVLADGAPGMPGGCANKMLRAKIARNEIVIDRDMRTTVPGLYAAGCVTPANCRMIIWPATPCDNSEEYPSQRILVESDANHSNPIGIN